MRCSTAGSRSPSRAVRRIDSASWLTWVELTGSGSVAIDASSARVIASTTSGAKAAPEKSLIASPNRSKPGNARTHDAICPSRIGPFRFSGSRGKHPEAGFGSTQKSGTGVGESRCPPPDLPAVPPQPVATAMVCRPRARPLALVGVAPRRERRCNLPRWARDPDNPPSTAA
jgi:hypothetical protein